jgi:hypothetical protein
MATACRCWGGVSSLELCLHHQSPCDGPAGLCFVHDHYLRVVLDCIDRGVPVVGVDSELIRDVVSGCVPTQRHGVACCALDDLVVADSVDSGVVVLSVDGDVLVSCRDGPL